MGVVEERSSCAEQCVEGKGRGTSRGCSCDTVDYYSHYVSVVSGVQDVG